MLNPEENHNFLDQYLHINLDFSETIFICTANYEQNMLEPLLDRIEVIKIDDYTFQEKKEITSKFIIPKVLNEFGFLNNNEINNHNLPAQTIQFDDKIVEKLIKEFAPVTSGLRGIKRSVEKLIRKCNTFLIQHPQLANLIVNDEILTKNIGDKSMYDTNFMKMLKGYNEPGSSITADHHGNIVKIIMKQKPNTSTKIEELKEISSKSILKHINIISNTEKHVEELLNISVHLAKDRIIDLYNKNINNFGKNNFIYLMKEYNIWLSNPYHKKHGNGYGLAFYITILSSVLDTKIENTKLLILGELSPLGNILKVDGLQRCLNRCEYYDIDTIVLPEGNKEEFNKFMKQSGRNYNVYYVKNADEAFELFFPKFKQQIEIGSNRSMHVRKSPLPMNNLL